jgi:hypothetical protein
MVRNESFLLIPALLSRKKGDAQGLAVVRYILALKGSFNLFLHYSNLDFNEKQ